MLFVQILQPKCLLGSNLVCSGEHGHRKDFFQSGGTRGFFQNFSRGAKSGEILLFPFETKKTPFLLKFSKSRGVLPPPLPTPMAESKDRVLEKRVDLNCVQRLSIMKTTNFQLKEDGTKRDATVDDLIKTVEEISRIH